MQGRWGWRRRGREGQYNDSRSQLLVVLGWGPGQSHQVLWLCPALDEGSSPWLTNETYFQYR